MAASTAPSFPFHIKEHAIPSQHVREWPRATANSQEDVLQLAIKQYIPIDNPDPQPGDVTLIGTHANGFPKELYEALWAELHTLSLRPGSGFRIRAIWIADVVNQGASGVLNETVLGNDPSWHDHARDLLHMTNVFRAEMPRPLVGIGHSFGGNCLANLALLHPRLLTSLILLDPVIINFTFQREGAGITPARSSSTRRDVWPSLEDAAASFRRSPFYRSWDPRVLDAWIRHAIRPVPTALVDSPRAGATLTTTRHQEVFTFFRPLWQFADPSTGAIARRGAPDFDRAFSGDAPPQIAQFPFYRSEGSHVLSRLPHLRPSVLWVAGETSDLSTPELRRQKLEATGVGTGGSGGVAEGQVAEVVMQGRGHLFPMEVPAEVAAHAASWLGREMARWRDEEREYDEWTRLPLREKTTLSDEYMARIGRPKKPKPGKKKEEGTVAEEKGKQGKSKL